MQVGQSLVMVSFLPRFHKSCMGIRRFASSKVFYGTNIQNFKCPVSGRFNPLYISLHCQRAASVCTYTCRELFKCSYLTTEMINTYLLPFRGMAGHSKWQNIRHVKASNDAKKALLFQKHSIILRRAVVENGPDPKLNSKLAEAIEAAKSHNMPSSSIETAIKKATNSKLKSHEYEILGPGGCLLVVNTESDSATRTKGELKHFCRKFQSALVDSKKNFIYEQKGIITVSDIKDNLPLDVDKALETAIESGAEDVQQVTDEEGKVTLKFICSADDFFQVKKKLENSPYIIQDASVEYLPRITVELNEEDMELAGKLFDQLQCHPDVVKVYDNIQ